MRLIASLLCLLLSGCSALGGVASLAHSTDRFSAAAGDPRVRYEPGAERLAEAAARELGPAIERVEREQYGRFPEPVSAYVSASPESCHDFCRGPVAGCVVGGARLFICPKAEERLTAILTHELSHLQMVQRAGVWRWVAVPPWFQEGLAVLVSGGGGAEKVSELEAIRAIGAGRNFEPDPDAGGLFFPKRAPDYGLEHHMFYRQGGLFVGYLRERDAGAFEATLSDLVRGEPLGSAVAARYGATVPDLWRDFAASMATRTAQASPR